MKNYSIPLLLCSVFMVMATFGVFGHGNAHGYGPVNQEQSQQNNRPTTAPSRTEHTGSIAQKSKISRFFLYIYGTVKVPFVRIDNIWSKLTKPTQPERSYKTFFKKIITSVASLFAFDRHRNHQAPPAVTQAQPAAPTIELATGDTSTTYNTPPSNHQLCAYPLNETPGVLYPELFYNAYPDDLPLPPANFHNVNSDYSMLLN
jgi:hypothetical protein